MKSKTILLCGLCLFGGLHNTMYAASPTHVMEESIRVQKDLIAALNGCTSEAATRRMAKKIKGLEGRSNELAVQMSELSPTEMMSVMMKYRKTMMDTAMELGEAHTKFMSNPKYVQIMEEEIGPIDKSNNDEIKEGFEVLKKVKEEGILDDLGDVEDFKFDTSMLDPKSRADLEKKQQEAMQLAIKKIRETQGNAGAQSVADRIEANMKKKRNNFNTAAVQPHNAAPLSTTEKKNETQLRKLDDRQQKELEELREFKKLKSKELQEFKEFQRRKKLDEMDELF